MAKTKESLVTLNNRLPDNTSNEISEADLRDNTTQLYKAFNPAEHDISDAEFTADNTLDALKEVKTLAGSKVGSVNGKTGASVTINADDISDAATTKKFTTAADASRLANTTGTNTGDQDLSGKQDILGFTPENVANKNQANGYAPLDAGGKVPSANLPSTLLIYKSTWNASTNTPTLEETDITKKGFVYTVSVAGTQFGISWKLGDWLVYSDAGVAEKSDNSDDVTSVNGKQGAVVLVAGDIADFASTVIATLLSGLSVATSAVITAADSIVGALGKLQAQISGKQDTLVSATNIKTVNGVSILGSGDLPVSATPAGANGQLQFNSAGAFGADSLLDWDNTNKRLGVGIAVPLYKLHVKGLATAPETIASFEHGSTYLRILKSTYFIEFVQNSGYGLRFADGITLDDSNYTIKKFVNGIGFGSAASPAMWLSGGQLGLGLNASLLARLHVKGSGNTAATVALRVESSTSPSLLVNDANQSLFNGSTFDASAQQQIDSTTKGFLPPRMTTTQKNAISAPAAGLMVYDTTLNKLCVFTTAWETLTSA